MVVLDFMSPIHSVEWSFNTEGARMASPRNMDQSVCTLSNEWHWIHCQHAGALLLFEAIILVLHREHASTVHARELCAPICPSCFGPPSVMPPMTPTKEPKPTPVPSLEVPTHIQVSPFNVWP